MEEESLSAVERMINLVRHSNVQLVDGIKEEVEMLVQDLENLAAIVSDLSMFNEDFGIKKEIEVLFVKIKHSIGKVLVEPKKHSNKFPAAKFFGVLSKTSSVRNVIKEIRSTRDLVREVCDDTIKRRIQYRPTLGGIPYKTTPEPREGCIGVEAVAVSALIERLIKLVHDNNIRLIDGTKEDAMMLVHNLERWMAFSRFNKDFEIKKEIRLLVYRTEDSIDKILVENRRHENKLRAAKFFDVPYIVAVTSVFREISLTKNKVKIVCDTANIMDIPYKTTPQPKKGVLSDEDDNVCFDDDETNIVIKRLIGGSTDLEVVPITGMAGLGKSTLARKVYKDSIITNEFYDRIWVGVYQTYTKKNILLKILANFTRRRNQYETLNEDQVIDSIRTFLENRGRCLLVLDDVWDKYMIDFIKGIFPENKRSHRIMITTRLVDVASCLSEDIHIKNFLNGANSWILLEKMVFMKETCPTELEEIGKSIAKRCIGLPLAIVVTARALACCNTKGEWQLVEQNIGTVLMNRDDPYSCLASVKMSYDLLSCYQKACFLYCATFPLGFEIAAWKLIRLWVSEGFISSSPNMSLEEQAEDWLNDLTRKNLVMVMQRRLDGGIKTCRIHDIVYEFCRNEANEEGLFQKIRFSHNMSLQMIDDPHNCRRLSVNSPNLHDFIPSKEFMGLELVRSFLCCPRRTIEMPPGDMKSIIKAFPLIRVLEVESIKSTNILSREFFQLLHLRYVSLSGNFSVLTAAFGRFWDLETLILNTTIGEGTIDIKADIWSMPRLRHFHTNIPAKLSSHNVPTGSECLIQTLSVITPESCTKKVFARAPNLRKLKIQGNVVKLLDANSGALSNLAESTLLEELTLANSLPWFSNAEVISLPMLVSIFPKTLRKLTFSGTRLEWSELNKVGQLESLQVLKLREGAFMGDYWETKIGSFTSLLVLWIERTDLKSWEASPDSFPRLKRLFLISCDKLEEVPQSLADIRNLQEIKLENTPKAVRSARNIEREKRERCSTVQFKLFVFPPDTVM